MAIKNSQAGVTLIEMIVVVGIIAVISSVMIFNYSDFSTNVSIRNLTQEIALSARKAQTYATSVRPVDALNGLSSRTFSGYGISFSTDSSTGGNESFPTEKRFVLFADTATGGGATPDNIYEAGASCGNPIVGDECLEVFTIASADRIVCITDDASVSNDACTTAAPVVDISFLRPSPDAYICFKGSVSDTQCFSRPSFVKIVLESAKGLRRGLSIWNTGQISVQ